MYLIDTNVVSELRKGARADIGVSAFFAALDPQHIHLAVQTIGELRNRASRMHALETTDVVKNILDGLMARSEPFVKELPPAPGDRAPRFMQLLCPEAHPIDAAPVRHTSSSASAPASAPSNELLQRIETLERDMAHIKQVIAQLGG